jgi:hypothetical protein
MSPARGRSGPTIAPSRCLARKRRCHNVLALAPTAESSAAPENFFTKATYAERLPPFWARNRFLRGFGRGGMSNFQNPKDPPTGGSHLPHAHPSSFEMRRTVPVATRAPATGAIYANLARSRGTCRAKARCIGRCAGCSCGRGSVAGCECPRPGSPACTRRHVSACGDAR